MNRKSSIIKLIIAILLILLFQLVISSKTTEREKIIVNNIKGLVQGIQITTGESMSEYYHQIHHDTYSNLLKNIPKLKNVEYKSNIINQMKYNKNVPIIIAHDYELSLSVVGYSDGHVSIKKFNQNSKPQKIFK